MQLFIVILISFSLKSWQIRTTNFILFYKINNYMAKLARDDKENSHCLT